jgi:DNA-binding response OmpR family regulator
VLRRARAHRCGELSLGQLVIDVDQPRVLIDGEPVHLTRKELQLLVALARTPGLVVTKDRLMAEVWNTSERRGSRAVDSHVYNLRAKIRPAATIESVRGLGYRLRLTEAGHVATDSGAGSSW